LRKIKSTIPSLWGRMFEINWGHLIWTRVRDKTHLFRERNEKLLDLQITQFIWENGIFVMAELHLGILTAILGTEEECKCGLTDPYMKANGSQTKLMVLEG